MWLIQASSMLTRHHLKIKQHSRKTCVNQQPVISSLILPSEIQVHRQVPLTDAKVLKTTKLALGDLFQKFDSLISKNNADIGHTDLIEMHIANRIDVTTITAHPYPLPLKHHDFLKQEIKNLLNIGIMHKSMSPWASPVIVIKKHTPESSPQEFQLWVNHRKLNSLLPTITPATGTKKGAIALMPLLKIDELFALLKGTKFFTALDL